MANERPTHYTGPTVNLTHAEVERLNTALKRGEMKRGRVPFSFVAIRQKQLRAMGKIK